MSTLLYDADCGFCRWTVGVVLAWDRHRRLRPLPIQDAGPLLDAVPPDRRMLSWHLVEPGGRVLSAGAAAAPLLRLLGGGRPLAALLARFPEATERAYRWVAEHREFFGPKLPRRAIQWADKLIVRRAAP